MCSKSICKTAFNETQLSFAEYATRPASTTQPVGARWCGYGSAGLPLVLGRFLHVINDEHFDRPLARFELQSELFLKSGKDRRLG